MTNDTTPFAGQPDLSGRLDLLHALAAEAGRVALDFFAARAELVRETKANALDFVSRADREVEALIRTRIAQAFPEDAFIGEEGKADPLGEGFVWIVDPIDGTTNFLHGLPYWCVSIALALNGTVIAARVEAPVQREHFTARLGQGAFCGARQMSVSEHQGVGGAILSLGRIPMHQAEDAGRSLTQLVQAGAEFRRFGAAALCMAHLADARLHYFHEAELSLWDYAAGRLLVTEAGGLVAVSDSDAVAIANRVSVSAMTVGLESATRGVACCRFRGHEDKIVSTRLETADEETNVQQGVQDRGREACAGPRRCRGSGQPGS